MVVLFFFAGVFFSSPLLLPNSTNISFSKLLDLFFGSNDKNSTANFVSLGLSGNIFFSMPAPPFQHGHKNYIMPWRDTKQKKLFSLIYGLSLTIMKDIQGCVLGLPAY